MLTLLVLASSAPASPFVRTPPAPAASLPEGVSAWAGSYTCAQGLTELTLTVTRTGDQLVGTFAFGPLPENPAVPSGAFRMHGTVHGDHVTLTPGDWLERPGCYVTVGLDGELDGDVLRGVVTTPIRGCTTFSVTRSGR